MSAFCLGSLDAAGYVGTLWGMTTTDIEKVILELPLPERAALLARVQLTNEERDELDDERDRNNPEVLAALAESREDVRHGRVRPFSEFMTELDTEERAKQ